MGTIEVPGEGLIYEGCELAGLEHATNYYQWLLDEFRPVLRGTVLEIGAGTGTFSRYLLNTGISCLICVEPAVNLIPLLRERTTGHDVQILEGTLERCSSDLPSGCVDAIVCINVLEHIEEDLQALCEMNRLLVSEGHLCLFVPALPWLYGTLDESFGHQRRYTRGDLLSKVWESGFQVIKCRYFNAVGIITWFLMSKVLRWRTWNASPVDAYDKLVIPFLSRLERIFAPPVGQSLLTVARK